MVKINITKNEAKVLVTFIKMPITQLVEGLPNYSKKDLLKKLERVGK